MRLSDTDVKSTAINGKDALELYWQFKPDMAMLFSSCQNVMDFTPLSRIREGTCAKVAVLTADTKKQDFERLQRLKPAKIVSNPYDTYAVLDMMIFRIDLFHDARHVELVNLCLDCLF